MDDLERRIKAKIPGEDTGIIVKHSMCDMCTPGPQCGINAYIKDGKIIKIEGIKGWPGSNGKLCTKGSSNRQYVYRKDRLPYPMIQVGGKGSGKYERISWDEALDICAEKFIDLRDKYGPESVAWITGYSKWLRPWLHRLTHSFGSLNFITESSTCHRAEVMSYTSVFGKLMLTDLFGAKNVICWGCNPYVNVYLRGNGLYALMDRGGKIVCIDPRMTQTAQKNCSVYLRPRIGTDAVLANAMANEIIRRDAVDHDFIEKYVHGYEEYKDMVSKYSLEMAEDICRTPKEDVLKAVDIFLEDDRGLLIPGNGLTHHTNGFQQHRATLCLMVITGRIDCPGGYTPESETFCHSDGGFHSKENDYHNDVRPKDCLPGIGRDRFPLWREWVDEAQGMDFVNQVNSGKPYPLHGAACFGVNHMMYPQSSKYLEALDKLDFVMATDIFDTQVCRHADIMLPVSTSFERSELKFYGGRFVNFTTPIIDPVCDNRDDVTIMADLAKRMNLGDELLEKGYDAAIEYMMVDSGITDWQAVKDSDMPVPVPNAKPYQMGTYLANPKNTPTGKIELYSEVIAKYQDMGLNPLTEYEPGDSEFDPEEYPFTMLSGGRIPQSLHSRTAQSSWLRSLEVQPALEINPVDAAKLGIKNGEKVRVSTSVASIELVAKVDETFVPGEVGMFHGYKEANVNELIPMTHLDKYTGFPGFKQFRCKVEKA